MALALSAVVIAVRWWKSCLFFFLVNIQQMSCEKKIAAKAISRAPCAFCVFEHFPYCTLSFNVYLNNFH